MTPSNLTVQPKPAIITLFKLRYPSQPTQLPFPGAPVPPCPVPGSYCKCSFAAAVSECDVIGAWRALEGSFSASSADSYASELKRSTSGAPAARQPGQPSKYVPYSYSHVSSQSP